MIKRATHRRHAVDRGEKTKLSEILVTGAQTASAAEWWSACATREAACG